MKIASIVLKIVAVLGAAFCVYAWLDTRGKISTAETHMKDVQGTDVVSKAANVPGILKNLAAEKQKVAGLQKTVVNMQSEADKITRSALYRFHGQRRVVEDVLQQALANISCGS